MTVACNRGSATAPPVRRRSATLPRTLIRSVLLDAPLLHPSRAYAPRLAAYWARSRASSHPARLKPLNAGRAPMGSIPHGQAALRSRPLRLQLDFSGATCPAGGRHMR